MVLDASKTIPKQTWTIWLILALKKWFWMRPKPTEDKIQRIWLNLAIEKKGEL